MLKGRVIGEVWATKKCASLQHRRLKLVAVRGAVGPLASGRVVVAVDTLDAQVGNAVMVSFGSGARNVISPGARENLDVLCECAVSQIIDGEQPG